MRERERERRKTRKKHALDFSSAFLTERYTHEYTGSSRRATSGEKVKGEEANCTSKWAWPLGARESLCTQEKTNSEEKEREREPIKSRQAPLLSHLYIFITLEISFILRKEGQKTLAHLGHQFQTSCSSSPSLTKFNFLAPSFTGPLIELRQLFYGSKCQSFAISPFNQILPEFVLCFTQPVTRHPHPRDV